MNPQNWQQIKEIFYAALDLPETERQKFLSENCGSDENLLSEVNSLLDAAESSEDFIESSALAVKHLIEEYPKISRIGQTVGAYNLESEIGRGGMGAVYLGTRADKEFKKKVAVKLIKRGLDTDEIIKRFRHERQILATLEHPNIARLLDGGATADGLPFLVMDYVEGLPLMEYCQENALDIDERLDLFLKICSAVAYAHRNLIVHRDLKPSNILVTKEETPKLLDFGIAKLLTPESDFSTLQTATNIGIMTPEYASPEQVKGENVTTATDVYSLGVLLYELLTDQRPYNFTTKSLEKIVHTVCESEPLRPSSLLLKCLQNVEDEQNPKSKIQNPKSLKGDLNNIVLMAMRKEPERRYSSIGQFADDIRRYQDGLPVLAQQDTFGYRMTKFVKRNKVGVAAAGIALSLIGGILGTNRQARIAARQRDKALAEAEKAEKINRFLQKMLASPDPRVVGKDVKVLEVLELAASEIDTNFAAQPEIAADLQTTIGLTYLSLGQFEIAEPFLDGALEARIKIFGENHRETAMSFNYLGQLMQEKGDFQTAEPNYLKALKIIGNVEDEKAKLDCALILHNYGYLLGLQGENEKSVKIHSEALDIRCHYLGENYPDTAFELTNLIGAIHKTKPQEAEKLALEALHIRRKIFGENHPDTAWSYYNLAFLAGQRGDNSAAADFANKVLTMRENDLPNEHPSVGGSLLVLGKSLLAQGKPESAKSYLEECLTLRGKTLPEDHYLLATTGIFLGECLLRLNETEMGKRLLFESFENLKEKLGENHEQTQIALSKIKEFFPSKIV